MARAEETSLAEEQRVWFGLVRVVHLAGRRFRIFRQVKGEDFADRNHGGAARLW